MPKVVLEFNLPEESEDLDLARNAGAMQSAIAEFYQNSIRRRLKYEELTNSDYKLMEAIKEEFVAIMNENKVEF